MELNQETFCVYLEFEKHSKNPAQIFSTMSNFIETMKEIDSMLVESLNIKIKQDLILEDLEIGSIKVFLKNTLEAIDNNDLKKFDWKSIVGKFLHKGKEAILCGLNDIPKIENKQDIQAIKTEIIDLAKDTKITHLDIYKPIPDEKILSICSKVVENTSSLEKNQHIGYISQYGGVKIRDDLKVISSSEIEEILTKNILENEIIMILKVKKPDYLGESMWELRHEDKAIAAKIVDKEWLKKFQNKKIAVGPGDSLKADVKIKVMYGYDNEVVGTSYAITKVHDVLRVEVQKQLELFDKKEKTDNNALT